MNRHIKRIRHSIIPMIQWTWNKMNRLYSVYLYTFCAINSSNALAVNDINVKIEPFDVWCVICDEKMKQNNRRELRKQDKIKQFNCWHTHTYKYSTSHHVDAQLLGIIWPLWKACKMNKNKSNYPIRYNYLFVEVLYIISIALRIHSINENFTKHFASVVLWCLISIK